MTAPEPNARPGRCACEAPATPRMNRTNMRHPAHCRRCGARLTVADLFVVLMLENRALEARVAELEKAAT